ncbi:Rho-GAP domain-containing protein [Balamuthia mandrillaris]
MLRILALANGLKNNEWTVDMRSFGIYWDAQSHHPRECVICNKAVRDKRPLKCAECERLFHRNCVLEHMKRMIPRGFREFMMTWAHGVWCNEECSGIKLRQYQAKQVMELDLRNEEDVIKAIDLVQWLAKKRVEIQNSLLRVGNILGSPLFPFDSNSMQFLQPTQSQKDKEKEEEEQQLEEKGDEDESEHEREDDDEEEELECEGAKEQMKECRTCRRRTKRKANMKVKKRGMKKVRTGANITIKAEMKRKRKK